MTLLKLVACMMLATLVTASVLPKPRQPVDVFRMMAHFPRAVIVYASTNETALKCATTTRTYFDPGAKKATYVWDLKSDGYSVTGNIRYDVEEGNSPDAATFFVENDRTRPYTAICVYTDYNTCFVLKMPFQGQEQCMLWVKPAVIDSIPGHCRNKYKQNCPVRFPTYNNDLCEVE
ncbi:uncharacterized protein [Dermacentor albipictus]|uniref:uncharacterized protein n=1 Tax=Dermacentor albipictus TaxID=60249 RepID=UPI0031FBCFDD